MTNPVPTDKNRGGVRLVLAILKSCIQPVEDGFKCVWLWDAGNPPVIRFHKTGWLDYPAKMGWWSEDND
jgi:hypothetical protein